MQLLVMRILLRQEADPDGFSLIPPLDAGLTKQQVCHKLKQQLSVALETSFSLSQRIKHIQSTFIEPMWTGLFSRSIK